MLDKTEQIEEMAYVVLNRFNATDSVTSRDVAKALYKEGYRKASDVAREIFDGIEEILYKYDKIAERDKSEYGELIVGDIACAIGELKKKCTEDINDV